MAITLHRWIFIGYTIVTLFILALLKLKLISYGIDSTNAILLITFLLLWVIALLFRWICIRTKRNVQLVFMILSAAYMLFITFYYFFENRFHVT